jgi:hypothetical protein
MHFKTDYNTHFIRIYALGLHVNGSRIETAGEIQITAPFHIKNQTNDLFFTHKHARVCLLKMKNYYMTI